MEKITKLIEDRLSPFAKKISSNHYLMSISDGFEKLIPVTIIGAIFTLLSTLQIEVYQNFIANLNLDEILSFVPNVTLGMMALYAVVFIGYSASKRFDLKESSILVTGLSVICFLLLIPLGIYEFSELGESVSVNAIRLRYLGASGLFTAMIVGLLVPKLYQFILKRKWVIALPPSVPPGIRMAFQAILPMSMILFAFSLLRFVVSLTEFNSFNNLIFRFLQQPLMGLGANPITFIILIFLTSLFFFFGIHGGQITNPFLSSIYIPLAIENLEALQSGVDASNLPHLIVQSNWFVYASIGGGGGTVGLVILMFFFSKSTRYKTLSKPALPATFCGMNEPIVFGLPIVLNPTTMIPFFITPIITFIIGYLATVAGIVPPLNGVQILPGTPIIFSAWITGGIRVVILQVLLIALQVLIYLPFFKVLDKQALLEEAADIKISY